jgi:hypothetical protein
MFSVDSDEEDTDQPKLVCELGGCQASIRGHIFASKSGLNSHFNHFHPAHVYPEKRGTREQYLPAPLDPNLVCEHEGCGRAFSSPKGRKLHFRDKHTNFTYPEDLVTCPHHDCRRSKRLFSNPQSCATHIKNKHPGVWKAEKVRRSNLKLKKYIRTPNTDPIACREVARFMDKQLTEQLTADLQQCLLRAPTRQDAKREVPFSSSRVQACIGQYRHLFGLVIASGFLKPAEIGLDIFCDLKTVQHIMNLLKQRALASSDRQNQTSVLSAEVRSAEFHYQLIMRMIQAVSFLKESGAKNEEQSSEYLLNSEHKRFARLRKGAGKKVRLLPVKFMVSIGKWIEQVNFSN